MTDNVELANTSENPFEGMENATPDLAIVKHDWNGRVFLMGDERLADLVAMILFIRGGIRRDYESEFDKQNIKNPECYSVDGVEGSRPQEQKVFNFLFQGKQNIDKRAVNVYGNCKDCHFSQFKTSGIWKNFEPRGGQQCSSYALAFLLLDSGMPAILQVPPTSSRIVPDQVQKSIISKPGRSTTNSWWRFSPCGAGNGNNSIKVTHDRGATPEEMQFVVEKREAIREFKDDFVTRFAQGGNLEETHTIAQARSDFAGDEI